MTADDASRHGRTSLDGADMRALEELLGSLFGTDGEDLRRHLRHEPDGAALVAAIPSSHVAVQELVHRSVIVLDSTGRLRERGFFDRLAEHVPRRADEIREIQQRLAGDRARADATARAHVLIFRGQFREQATLFATDEALAALAPIRPVGEPELLDWPALEARDVAAWRAGLESLRDGVGRFLSTRVMPAPEHRIAAFALGPTPWLVALGDCLGDTVPVQIHGRLREPPTWRWQAEAWPETRLQLTRQFPRQRPARVALLLSISAQISREDVDAVLPRRGRALCELSLERPRLDAIRSEAQLHEFERRIRDVLGEIAERAGRLCPVHIFAAAPAPILLALGRALPRRVMADVRLHDYDGRHGFSSPLPLREP